MLNITGLPAILKYGNSLPDHTDSSTCILQYNIGIFFYFQYLILPAVLEFYLWWALFNKDNKIEEKCLIPMSLTVWILGFGFQMIRLFQRRNEQNWGLVANRLFCKPSPSNIEFYGWLILQIIIVISMGLLAIHSTILLFSNWRQYSRKQSRGNAMKFEQTIRLCTSSFLYATFIFSIIIFENNETDLNKITGSQFMIGASGICIFLMFALTRSAAQIFPCCYYASLGSHKSNVKTNIKYYSPTVDKDSDSFRPPTTNFGEHYYELHSIDSRLNNINRDFISKPKESYSNQNQNESSGHDSVLRFISAYEYDLKLSTIVAPSTSNV
ncbi:2900_t:CDS:2 [Ambispora gerdemannii]|uniref:2900_t:CDS:1 n=1 Tax=Ambispora gerdemannii TaxID=144530 RepID=A0A9N9CLB6_9GLOM|nr:2900_t:CDS:2 [Ambispora gerdemannii]